MNTLRPFERDAIKLLGAATPHRDTLARLLSADVPVEYEYTVVGYFITISSPELPLAREILTEPFVLGELPGVSCGFIAFLGNQELMLECHTWTDADIPPDFRDQAVVVRAALPHEISHPSEPG